MAQGLHVMVLRLKDKSADAGKCFQIQRKARGEYYTMALPFTLKSILRQKKKNYGN